MGISFTTAGAASSAYDIYQCRGQFHLIALKGKESEGGPKPLLILIYFFTSGGSLLRYHPGSLLR